MIRLYLIRHGETDWNKERRLQGQADIPLNAFGRHLALETAKGLKDVEFAAAYTSPLKRALETARLVLDRELPVYKDERIQEMGFGIYEGKCVSEEGWDIQDPSFHNFFDRPQAYQPPKGGESFAQVIRRERSFLSELCREERYEGKNVLISTHGAALCGMLNVIMEGKPVSAYWDGRVHKNCAVTIVDASLDGFTVREKNHVYYSDAVAQW